MAESARITKPEVPSCVFCRICGDEEPASIIFRNDKFVVFRDIRPASKEHVLVVPTRHIRNAKSLASGDSGMIDDMKKVAEDVLRENLGVPGEAFVGEEVRFGFHWPPLNQIDHLHLHAIYPVSSMGYVSRLIFQPNSFWFKSPEATIAYLRNRDGN